MEIAPQITRVLKRFPRTGEKKIYVMYGEKAYGDKVPETPLSEQIVDSIGELLDGVPGNCVRSCWIYP